jgi:D-glycero-D-manno-heptose 1,7-bisphosphate phosphatase
MTRLIYKKRKIKKIKIAFLDRDGTINKTKKKNYIYKLKDFYWIKGAIRFIKLLKKNNYKIIIITNQSGIARGIYKVSDMHKIHRYIQKSLVNHGVKIDKFFYCPYHPEGIVIKYKKQSYLRKPSIGMFLKAKKIYKNIDFDKSFVVGDQKSDISFAKKCKLKGYLFQGQNLYNEFSKLLSIENR